MWNKLYGPEAFGPWSKGASSGLMSSMTDDEREAVVREMMKYKPIDEPRPGVGKAKNGKTMDDRTKMLGY